jgi:hypothetical protein
MSPRFPIPPSDDFGSARVRPSFEAFADIPSNEPLPSSPPAASADLIAAVRRLTEVCADYLATAPRLGLQPTPEHLLRIIEAATVEATAGPPPAWGSDIEAYFLQGLYEELLQQPANLFTGTRPLRGEEIPVPISPENWLECLRVFRAAILRGDVVVPATKPTARYRGERRPSHVYVPLPGETAPAATRSTPEQLDAIREWTREFLNLGDDDVITLTELACRDPQCSALETVVAVFSHPSTRRWRFARPAAELTRTLVRQALTAGSVT